MLAQTALPEISRVPDGGILLFFLRSPAGSKQEAAEGG